MASVHLMMSDPVPPPGGFTNLGAIGVAAEFLLHLVCGAIMGALYGPSSRALW